METVVTLSAKRRKRRIRPPKPPNLLVALLIAFALTEAARYWLNLGLLGTYGWYIIAIIAWGFRDWALQSMDYPIYDYPMKGKPVWMRLIWVLCFPVTIVIEFYLTLVYIKNLFRRK